MPRREEPHNRPEPDFREIFEAVPGLYLILDPDLGIQAVSDAYLRATKTRREEILGRTIFDVFPDNPEDADATGVANLKASLDRVLALRRLDAMAVQKYDIRRPEAEGGGFEERYWSPTNSPILGSDGQLRYILHRVEDVTDYMRLLQQSRQKDKAAEKLKTRAGQMEAEIYLRAQELQEANGKLRALHATLEARVEERTAGLLQANDRLRQSEEQLLHAQKMEAVGRLAGGIAHDFNNLLTVIVLLGEELQATEGACPELASILSAAQRGALLVRQLLAFSRQQVMTLKDLDFHEVLGGMSEMLTRALGEDIDLNVVYGPDLRRFFGDPGQIDQVLLNLAINARDAMPSGGALTIEASNVTDVIMPEMNGRLVSELVRSFRPDLPVLFVSGYTDDAILRHGILDQGVPFLQKPFTPAQLRQKVREVLASPV